MGELWSGGSKNDLRTGHGARSLELWSLHDLIAETSSRKVIARVEKFVSKSS
jgi:hypothetical protein